MFEKTRNTVSGVDRLPQDGRLALTVRQMEHMEELAKNKVDDIIERLADFAKKYGLTPDGIAVAIEQVIDRHEQYRKLDAQ